MAIVRKDKMLAGYNGNLESVIVHDSAGKTLEITNGLFVKVKGLMDGQRETKKAVLAGIEDVKEDVLLIHNPEVMYDERLYKLADYRIEAGKVARAYRLYDGDIITLTDDLFADATLVNGKVTARPNYTAGTKLAVKANGKLGTYDEKTITPKVVFVVIEDSGNELDLNMGAFAVQVVRN